MRLKTSWRILPLTPHPISPYWDFYTCKLFLLFFWILGVGWVPWQLVPPQTHRIPVWLMCQPQPFSLLNTRCWSPWGSEVGKPSEKPWRGMRTSALLQYILSGWKQPQRLRKQKHPRAMPYWHGGSEIEAASITLPFQVSLAKLETKSGS